jgi:hypothetical protein
MALRENDLANTVLKHISLDEFQPKTGDEKDVAVLGFHVVQNFPGSDLYNFISSSVVECRDVELSPNPNTDGYYMVFVEMDRNEKLLDNIRSLIADVNNVTGKLSWKIKTPYLEEEINLNDDQLSKYVQSDPSEYLSAKEFIEKMQKESVEEDEKQLQEEAESNSKKILEFLRDSILLQAGFSEDGKLTVMGRAGNAQFEVVGFGDADDVLKEIGINESALAPIDSDVRKFNSMLGTLKAVKIDEYVVIFNTDTRQALVGKPC